MDSTLPDGIAALSRCGMLPHCFGVADIRFHFRGRFSENYIRTVLANFAEGGNYVKRGARARFRRVGYGQYQILG